MPPPGVTAVRPTAGLSQRLKQCFLRHERPTMMTVLFRESVSTPQGVGIKPTVNTFAPTRRAGLSTFPLATDPVSTAISGKLSDFGLAADFCSSSVTSFMNPHSTRSGSRAPRCQTVDVAEAVDGLSSRALAWSAWVFPSAADTPVPSARRDPQARHGRRRWPKAAIAFRQPQPYQRVSVP